MSEEDKRPRETLEGMAREIAYPCCQLTVENIRAMRKELDPNLVIAPYCEDNTKGCGYNLTATEFVYSVVKKRLLPVHTSSQGETYVYIGACDTVLLLTREYIKLSSKLAGAFYSRVQLVSDGLGHISTTLDPGWKGMLLFSICNPMRKKIKLVLCESSEGKTSYKGIATMILNPVSVSTGMTGQVAPNLDNPAMRLDVLKKLVSEPKRFVANRQYQSLRRLIEDLEHFQPTENESIRHLSSIKNLLLELEKEVNSYASCEEITGWLTELKRTDCGEFENLKAKIEALCSIGPLDGRVGMDAVQSQLLSNIESACRECDYQLLCDQVNQIHALIQSRVPRVWKHHTLKRLLGFLIDHWLIWLIYALAIVVLSILYRHLGALPEGAGILIPAAAAILPPLISYPLEHFRSHSEEDLKRR